MRRRSYAWRFLPALHRWRPPILRMLAAVLRRLRSARERGSWQPLRPLVRGQGLRVPHRAVAAFTASALRSSAERLSIRARPPLRPPRRPSATAAGFFSGCSSAIRAMWSRSARVLALTGFDFFDDGVGFARRVGIATRYQTGQGRGHPLLTNSDTWAYIILLIGRWIHRGRGLKKPE